MSLDLDQKSAIQFTLWTMISLGVIMLCLGLGWCVVWRCILVKLPGMLHRGSLTTAVREVFGLEESVHGPRRRVKPRSS
jgi:hypothetical protein